MERVNSCCHKLAENFMPGNFLLHFHALALKLLLSQDITDNITCCIQIDHVPYSGVNSSHVVSQ